MVRATYMVKARDPAGHLFEQSYQVNAPASLGTRSIESVNFLQTLSGSHCKRILQAAPFQCAICGKKAGSLVMQPSVSQAAVSVIHDQPVPVCGSAPCDQEARQNLQTMVQEMEKELGGDISNREAHLCAKCGKAGAKSYCSRCQVTSYCSRACRKDHWSMHKKICKPPKSH